MTTIESVRDKLLLSLDCLSRYRERGDKCQYCEVCFGPGTSCPHQEWSNRYDFETKTGITTQMDILTYAALANWDAYADYCGTEKLKAEINQDLIKNLSAPKVERVRKIYPFLQESA